MANQDILKEFLVALGYKVDEAQYKKFNEGVSAATKAVEYLGFAAGLTDTALGAFAYKAAQNLDKLYFAAGRSNSAVKDIQSLSYGFSQLGSSSEAAQAAIENLGNFMRTYPGSEAFLEKWGVAPEHTHNAAEALRDLEHTFQGMTFWQAKPIAQVLGIDDTALLAMQSGELDGLLEKYNKRLAEVGVNSDKAAKSGNILMTEVRDIGSAFEVAGQAIVETFGKPLFTVLKYIESAIKGFAILTTNPGQWLKNAEAAGFFTMEGGHLKASEGFDSAGVKAPTPGQTATQASIVDYFISQGWSRGKATAIARRLNDESGLNPGAVGDSGQAYGLAQWHPDRQKDFEQWSGHSMKGSNIQDQEAFVQYELTKGKEQRAGQALMSGSDSDAYRLFTNMYERPASPVTITQENKYEIHGTDPSSTAAAIADRHRDTNNQLIRNMQGAVQ